MGNQHTEFSSNVRIADGIDQFVLVRSDVSFRTSNYSPMDSKVSYVMIFKDITCPIDNQQISDLKNSFLLYNDHSSDCHHSISAENRRKFIHEDSNIINLINQGYTMVTIWPIKMLAKFIIILAKCDSSFPNPCILNVVNAQCRMHRLEGETLVVGSQKLVLAGSDKDDKFGNKDDLLETIAHETANGGRLIAAWPISESLKTSAHRMDLLFQVPEFSNNQYFAYQVSMLDDPFQNYDLSDESEHRNVDPLSDFMHKALEAGWGLVDVVLVSMNSLVWFFERRVTDALINEPSFEGRLLEIKLNFNNTELLAEELNVLGNSGWMLTSILQMPFEISTDHNTFIAFFQRPVHRTRYQQHQVQDVSSRNQAWSSRTHLDEFAPPNYPTAQMPCRSGRDIHTTLLPNHSSRLDDDESELPLYEDVIQQQE